MFLIVINAAIQQHLSSGFGAFPRGCLINHSPGELGQAGCCWLPEGTGDSLGGPRGAQVTCGTKGHAGHPRLGTTALGVAPKVSLHRLCCGGEAMWDGKRRAPAP